MEALQRLHNRGSISTGYDIDNSLKLEADNSEHLYVTTMTAGNTKTWTYSCWVKRTELGFTNVLIHFGVDSQVTRMMLNDDDTLYLDVCAETGTTLYRSITNRLFRDTSAWYHFVWRMDTTQGTEADRMKLYINGVEETSWAQHQIPPQNLQTSANTTAPQHKAMGIGTYVWAGSSYDALFSGYLAQVAHVDGQSYAPTEFGEFDDATGIWKPKDITGLTYGSSNNSFLLDFSTSSDLGNDSSGNNNDWSLSNITAADQATDTPTNNFCIANAIAIGTSNLFQFTEGGTVCKRITADQWDFFTTTMPVNKGKWYGEFKAGAGPVMVGIGSLSYFEGTAQSSHTGAGMATNSGVAYYGADGKRWVDGTEAAYGATFGTSDIISIAMDLDNDNVYFAKNGTWQNSGDPTSGATGTGALSTDPAGDYFVMTMNMLYNPTTHFMNYGGYTTISISSAASDENGYGTFEYAPPSGYYALCTKNLEEYG